MKIIYYSRIMFADCDLPLLREMHKKDIDALYYVLLPYSFQRGNVLEFDEPLKKWGIYKGTRLKGMLSYSKCIDLNRVYCICGYTRWWSPLSLLLWVITFFHMLVKRADIIHITWQLHGLERLLLYLPIPQRIMTVHDPIQHSGLKDNDLNEKERKRCFEWANRFVLLNEKQCDDFSRKYGIKKDRITLSHLGIYDTVSHIEMTNVYADTPKPYIIFFGTITPHKGLEYLIEAMIEVHSLYPNLYLLIAGSGEIYIDREIYKDLDYIRWENRYIGIHELASMIRNSLFTVCPYKDATQSGVILTSFALGTPVLATNVGILPDVVKDGVYGRIVHSCDSSSLSSVICELIENPEALDNMKKNINNQWKLLGSWETIADDYLSLYETCVLSK